MNSLLEVQNLSYAYHSDKGETNVLEHLHFSIAPGEFVAIVGPSGCGKSTLLSLICGLLTPDEGHLVTPPGLRIGYMLQKDHLLEWRNTFQNVALGPVLHHELPAKKNRLLELLHRYGLKDFTQAKPDALSGGMRQRAALIRTLIQDPDLLLLDEPFSALDYQTRLSVSEDIWQIIRQENKTALLITHDISEAISMADRVLVLTARPATVQTEIPIHLTYSPGQRIGPFQARQTPEFSTYFNQIWKELNP